MKERSKPSNPSSPDLPKQYPNKLSTTIANMCTQLNNLTTVDELDTDDEDMEIYGLIVNTQLNVYANFGKASSFTNTSLAYSDSGADSCILGKYAFITSYTRRHANLGGYNPSSTKTKSVPICRRSNRK